MNRRLAGMMAVCLAAMIGPMAAGSGLTYALPETVGVAREGVRSLGMGSELYRSPATRELGTWQPFIGFAWSFSGEKYAETRAVLEQLAERLTFDAVLALRLRDNAPAPGLGFSYTYTRGTWSAGAGIALLMPQNDRADITAGFTVGLRIATRRAR